MNRKRSKLPNKISFISFVKNRKRFREDASFIYRCENLGAALSKLGWSVRYSHYRSLASMMDTDVVVFHRPRACFLFYLLEWKSRRRATVVVSDFDDYIFDTQAARSSPAVLNGYSSYEEISKKFESHRLTLMAMDLIIVSTVPLEKHVARVAPAVPVLLLPNCVHHTWKDLVPKHQIELDNLRTRVITYNPGTRSHDRDFEVYRDGLTAFMLKHRSVRLEVTGPLTFSLEVPTEQVSRNNKVSFDQYHTRVENAWINLAPLEVSEFTDCKSAIKVIEAGTFGIPTICSPIPDTRRFNGFSAFPASNSGECFTQLTRLLESQDTPSVRRDRSNRMLSEANVDTVAGVFSNRLRRLINARTHCLGSNR